MRITLVIVIIFKNTIDFCKIPLNVKDADNGGDDDCYYDSKNILTLTEPFLVLNLVHNLTKLQFKKFTNMVVKIMVP